jgi:hypothetical protein
MFRMVLILVLFPSVLVLASSAFGSSEPQASSDQANSSPDSQQKRIPAKKSTQPSEDVDEAMKTAADIQKEAASAIGRNTRTKNATNVAGKLDDLKDLKTAQKHGNDDLAVAFVQKVVDKAVEKGVAVAGTAMGLPKPVADKVAAASTAVGRDIRDNSGIGRAIQNGEYEAFDASAKASVKLGNAMAKKLEGSEFDLSKKAASPKLDASLGSALVAGGVPAVPVRFDKGTKITAKDLEVIGLGNLDQRLPSRSGVSDFNTAMKQDAENLAAAKRASEQAREAYRRSLPTREEVMAELQADKEAERQARIDEREERASKRREREERDERHAAIRERQERDAASSQAVRRKALGIPDPEPALAASPSPSAGSVSSGGHVHSSGGCPPTDSNYGCSTYGQQSNTTKSSDGTERLLNALHPDHSASASGVNSTATGAVQIHDYSRDTNPYLKSAPSSTSSTPASSSSATSK